ncbi:MAG: hypothetical protein ACYSUM_02540 [Planctomycetota bacterium]|jgi:hypothetical protein
MSRIRLLFLVALLAVAAFAIVPAMAEDTEDKAVGPVGRWDLRIDSTPAADVYVIDTVTGRVHVRHEGEWRTFGSPAK